MTVFPPLLQKQNTTNAPVSKPNEASLVLQRKHNARLPISRLPAEILENVFITFIYNNITTPTYPDFEYDIPEFHRLLHDLQLISSICSRWRSVAVNCSPLWTFLPLNYRTCALELSHRANGAPIRIYSTKEVDQRVINQLLSSPSQFRQIRFLDTIWSLNSLIPALEHHSPTLEAIRFEISRDIGQRPIDLATIFSLSSIRQVTISGYSLGWRADKNPQAPLLTSLCLKQSLSILSDKLLATLHMTPALESLVVIEPNAIITHTQPLSTTGSIAQLDKLSTLQIDSMFDRCMAFLSRLQYPQPNRIRVTAWDSGSMATPVEYIPIERFMQLCGLTNASSARHLEFKSTFDKSSGLVSLSLWDTTACYLNDSLFMFRDRIAEPRITICLRDYPDQAGLIRAMVPHLSVPNVEQLTWLADDDESGCEELCELARRLPGVKDMALLGSESILRYQSLFCLLLNQGDKQRAQLKYFPSLSFLQISDVDFDYHEYDVEELKALGQILKYRRKHGARLDILSIKECYCVDAKLISDLRKQNNVKQVVWDDLEQGFSDWRFSDEDFHDELETMYPDDDGW